LLLIWGRRENKNLFEVHNKKTISNDNSLILLILPYSTIKNRKSTLSYQWIHPPLPNLWRRPNPRSCLLEMWKELCSQLTLNFLWASKTVWTILKLHLNLNFRRMYAMWLWVCNTRIPWEVCSISKFAGWMWEVHR